MPYVGCIAAAKICICTVHCVECFVLSHEFNGILRKENIMPIKKEKVKMNCVVSDIGDLSERMIPCSFGEVKSVITNTREPRKVAHIPDLNH
uniref:Uncharacterized protein n=1 Tax=Wuchereria bancrofti TaxID=6293 RepID=A0A1I8EJV1_WUCBA